MAVSYLQFRFDQSDIKHAVAVVREMRPKGPETIEELVSRSYHIPPQQIQWEPKIESKWEGTVVIRATTPQGEGNLAWKVDLVRYSVIPINLETIRLIQ
jgi:hypothetical protein